MAFVMMGLAAATAAPSALKSYSQFRTLREKKEAKSVHCHCHTLPHAFLYRKEVSFSDNGVDEHQEYRVGIPCHSQCGFLTHSVYIHSMT
jgi:hypothetical protein